MPLKEDDNFIGVVLLVGGPKHGQGLTMNMGDFPESCSEDPNYEKVTLRFSTTVGIRECSYYRFVNAGLPKHENTLRNELIDAMIIFNSDF